jgi:hypothetical protein
MRQNYNHKCFWIDSSKWNVGCKIENEEQIKSGELKLDMN